MTVQAYRDHLIGAIAKCAQVKGVGQTGDINAPLIPGQSDIDLFVLCTAVPSPEERRALYAKAAGAARPEMEDASGGGWGHGDILTYGGVEIMPMYFTIQEMEGYLVDVLQGKHIEKEGRFYPSGRLASVETLHVLYEEDEAWTRLVRLVAERPQPLFAKEYEYHIACALDEEDLGRSLLRKEALFYHQVLEEALDHLLQALYAANERYFPSRKRTEKAIASFERKPRDCWARLCRAVEDGARSETIEASVRGLRALIDDTRALGAPDCVPPEARALAERFAEACARTLGDNLTGVYLHGSAAMGCFHPQKSDIDLLAVVEQEPSDTQKLALMKQIVRLNEDAPAKGLEMSVVLRADCKPFVYPTPFSLHFSSMHLKWFTDQPDAYIQKMKGTDRDLAAHFTIVGRCGVTLRGLPAEEVFGEVPARDYADSIWRDIEDAREDIADDPMYVTLTLCRVLGYLRDGRVLSKRTGGEWGLINLPEKYRPLIREALDCYRSDRAMRADAALAKAYADELMEEIERRKAALEEARP